MKEAIIAVASTVIGIILGWILNTIKIGELMISLDNFDEDYRYIDNSLMSIPGKEKNELYHVVLTFTIQLYNASQTNKSIRDCTLLFDDSNGIIIMQLKVEYQATRRSSVSDTKYDTVDVVNVEPYQSRNISAVAFTSNIDTLYETKKICFQYKTPRLKLRRKAYKNINFSEIARKREE